MAFQIRNSLGEPISLHQLDIEASEFWGKPISTKKYAQPYTSSTDWFDSIGWAISNPVTLWKPGWENIKNSLWLIQANGLYKELYSFSNLCTSLEITQAFLKPYFDLIDYWESKGYTPHQVA